MSYAPFPYEFPILFSPLSPPPQPPGIAPISSSVETAAALLRQRLIAMPGTALPNVQAILQVFANQCDSLEYAFQALYYYRQLPNAFGQMLDNIGAIVGLARAGLDDPTYRLYLQAQIRADNSGGTTNDLNAIFLLIVPSGVSFALTWWGNASFVIYLTDSAGTLTQAEINAFESFMNRARAAGVYGVLNYPPPGVPDNRLFRFDTPGVGFDQGLFRGAVS